MKRYVLICISLLFFCMSSFVRAKMPTAHPSFEKFMDSAMTSQMKKHHVPGAVVALLKNGKLFFKKGYGFSHIKSKEPMDPDRTVIRLGSISKLLTATTLMTFYDEGKFDFDDPVKKHLPKLQVDNPFDKPLCIKHLLTHTSGFDARYMNVLGRTPQPFVPLRPYLERYLPPIIRPPGEVIQYCNFGASLAGLMVEELSGSSLAETAKKRLCTPLQMKNTRFFLGQELEKGIARGYGWHGGRHHELSYAFVPITPAGGASSTAEDMAHLAKMFLARGQYDNHRVLNSSTVDEMEKRQFTNHLSFAGMGYGFFQYDKNGMRLIGHGGGVLGFASIFYLLPEQGFAYFVATNLSNGFAFLDDVERDILNHYFPIDKNIDANKNVGSDKNIDANKNVVANVNIGANVKVVAGKNDSKVAFKEISLKKYCGRYRGNRFPRSTCDKLLAIVLPIISEKRIVLDSSGNLVMDSVKFYFFSRYATKLIPVGDSLFEREDGRGTVAFIQDGEGAVKYMAFSSSPVSVFDAVAWYDIQLVHAFVLSIFFIIFIVGFLTIFIPWWKKRKGSSLPVAIRGIQGSLSLINLVIPLLPLIAVFPMEWECPNLVYGWPGYLKPFLYLPHLSVLMTILALFLIPSALRKNEVQTKESRIYLVFVLASICYLPYLVFWNFLP